MVSGCLDTPAGYNSLDVSTKRTKIEFLFVTLSRCGFVCVGFLFLIFTLGITDHFPISDTFMLPPVPWQDRPDSWEPGPHCGALEAAALHLCWGGEDQGADQWKQERVGGHGEAAAIVWDSETAGRGNDCSVWGHW